MEERLLRRASGSAALWSDSRQCFEPSDLRSSRGEYQQPCDVRQNYRHHVGLDALSVPLAPDVAVSHVSRFLRDCTGFENASGYNPVVRFIFGVVKNVRLDGARPFQNSTDIACAQGR